MAFVVFCVAGGLTVIALFVWFLTRIAARAYFQERRAHLEKILRLGSQR